MNPLRILFLNRSYYPDTTATGQLLTELCESLTADYGCAVSVVSGVPLSQEGKKAAKYEVHNEVKIVRAKGTTFSKTSFAGRASNYVSYFAGACLEARKLRADVIVAFTDPPIIGLAGLSAARKFRAPFVMSFQDIFPEVAQLLEDFRSPLVDSALNRVNCYLIRKADRIVTLGDSMSRKLIAGKNAIPSKIKVIPNWADCSVLKPGPTDNEFRRLHGLDGKFVVLHSGNIGLSQSLETIIDAAAILRLQPEIVFLFVGEGVRKKSLEEKAAAMKLNNVRFLPFVPKDLISQSYASADLFIISLKQGMSGYIVPSKLYGILASGRPFVAAIEADSEAADIAKEYSCGVICEPGNASLLAEKIFALYDDRNLTKSMGDKARHAGLKFDKKESVRKYYELFCELTGRGALATSAGQEAS